jgi:hypothetical protein
VIRECMNEPGLEFVWVGDDPSIRSNRRRRLNFGRRREQDARGGAGGSGPRADGGGSACLHKRRCVCRCGASCERRPQGFRSLEQKEDIFLTAYAGFPVAPTFMIWSSDLGSGWIRWPHDSTALWTPIIPDDATRSHRRHWSREASGLPSVPRRSSNRRRPPSPDSIGSNTRSAWLLFTHGCALHQPQAPGTH